MTIFNNVFYEMMRLSVAMTKDQSRSIYDTKMKKQHYIIMGPSNTYCVSTGSFRAGIKRKHPFKFLSSKQDKIFPSSKLFILNLKSKHAHSVVSLSGEIHDVYAKGGLSEMMFAQSSSYLLEC